jgi:hypothetical protein
MTLTLKNVRLRSHHHEPAGEPAVH